MIDLTEFPRRWQRVELGDVLTYMGNGLTKTQSKNGRGWPVTRIETLSDDYVDGTKVGYTDELTEGEVQRHLLQVGDMLLSHINSEPQIGRAVLYEGHPHPLLHGMNLLRLRVNADLVHPRFLEYLFRLYRMWGVFVALSSRAVGQSSINQGKLRAMEIVLPPLPEQRAIARALRAVQRARDARKREIELERERKAALMDYLFTHGTRNEPTKTTEIGEMPESWAVGKLGDLSVLIQYGTSEKCDANADELPVLRIPNVIGGKVDVEDLKYIGRNSRSVEHMHLQKGDVLFVRTNGRREYTGRSAVFHEEVHDASFASYLIRARTNGDLLLPDFLQRYTMLPQGQRFLSGKSSHAADGKFNINSQTIRNVLVPLPPLDEQETISGAADACDAKIAALEKESALLDELFCAMLEELMTGRLSAVPLAEADSAQ